MSQTTFMHLADVHLDSPLAKLRKLDEHSAGRMHRASRRAIEKVIQIALDRQVAAVVIAGDLFDAPVKDAGAGLWIESQLKRLTRVDIPVVLIRGNHDALSNASRIIHWSEGIHELGSGKPESLLLDSAGLAIHGQSFGARAESNDLAAHYPAAAAGYFNLGLLHTSLAGSSQHGTYAPTSIEVLEGRGYDYWALGHIHARSLHSLSSKCFIGYSGNLQGRHVREPGAKGINLVHLRDRQLESVEFLATDSIRWHEIVLDLGGLESLGEIEDLLPDQVVPLAEEAGGCSLAIRIRLSGSTQLHSQLTHASVLDRLGETLAHRLADVTDAWLETIKLATRPAGVSKGDGGLLPLKYLSQVADEMRSSPANREELMGLLDELLRKARAELTEYDWPLVLPDQQDDQLCDYLRQAEDLLTSRLTMESAE